MTSDFIPVRSGNCWMNCSLSPVRMPARPDCMAAAAPDVTMASYPSGSFSISVMRFPAATSSSGMCTKCRPACAITASNSGRITEPPSIVIVPWQLITVFTPNSSYGLPVLPRPFTFVRPCTANNLAGARIEAPIAPAVPRKLRRFQLVDSCIGLLLQTICERRLQCS